MTRDEIQQIFAGDDDFLCDDKIPIDRRHSNRPDLNAFMLLDHLVPTERHSDMVSWAGHDEIALSVSLDDLAASRATDDDIRDLKRCGVRYDAHTGALMMFV